MEIFNSYYSRGDQSCWKGRIDDDAPDFNRWHQEVNCVSIHDNLDFSNSVVILGFCCDEGVRRNQGREGAKSAPYHLRKILANLPVHFSSDIKLYDVGDVCVYGDNLEGGQKALALAVEYIKNKNGFPLLLGGGHEITYGHYKGLYKRGRKLGVINLDAHLDIRPLADGQGNSGTGFYQIHQDLMELGEQFNYLAIGIEQIANTKGLLKYAESCGVDIIYGSDLNPDNIENIKLKIQDFVNTVDDIYLTVDMDVFAAPFAPGVSATAMNGIIPNHNFLDLISFIYNQPKLISVDFAEVNPLYDIDERTSRLAGNLIFQLLQKF